MRESLARARHDALADALAARRLLPLLGGRAIDAAGDLLPERFHARVAAARTAARATGMAVEAATAHASAVLADHGIRALPLKGPLLALIVHGDLGVRETDDVDLLVAPEDLRRAVDVLAREGYAQPADPVRRNGLPDLHFALYHPSRASVELHWRIHYYEENFSRAMLERATPGDDGLLRAQLDDLLVSLLLFYARDGFHGLRLAADISAWCDRFGAGADDGFLARYAAEHPALTPPLSSAALAVERLTGAPAQRWLGDGMVEGRRVALAARFADWVQTGDRDQLAANMSLVDAVLTPAGRRRDFVMRELVPREGATAPHAVKMLARYVAGLWAVRGGRDWVPTPRLQRRRVELMGLPIDPVTEAEVVGHVSASLEAGRGGWLMTPNLDQLRQYVRAPELRGLFAEADLVVADGMPLLWATKLAGNPLPARVAGSDLIWSLTAETAVQGHPVFLLGGAPGVCERAAEALRQAYPGVRIAGCHSPPFGFEDDPEELRAIRSRLREAAPQVVYVALGFPKQERLIRDLRAEFPGAWFVGVGISFSFVAGEVPRAPDWMQKIGLEWVHRLANEPRRLARRYLVDGLPFAARLALHSALRRVRRRAPGRDDPSPVLAGGERVVFTHGAHERRRADDLAALGDRQETR